MLGQIPFALGELLGLARDVVAIWAAGKIDTAANQAKVDAAIVLADQLRGLTATENAALDAAAKARP